MMYFIQKSMQKERVSAAAEIPIRAVDSAVNRATFSYFLKSPQSRDGNPSDFPFF
jgi:hypothetical protein